MFKVIQKCVAHVGIIFYAEAHNSGKWLRPIPGGYLQNVEQPPGFLVGAVGMNLQSACKFIRPREERARGGLEGEGHVSDSEKALDGNHEVDVAVFGELGSGVAVVHQGRPNGKAAGQSERGNLAAHVVLEGGGDKLLAADFD